MDTYTISGDPRTKKNHQRVVNSYGHPIVIPSPQYINYAADAKKQLNAQIDEITTIGQPVNLKVLYYMRTRRRVDLVNLLQATCDILQETQPPIISDDCSKVIKSFDGSRVLYDHDNPRCEIYIEPVDYGDGE